MQDFSLKRDFKLIQWGPTLLLNLVRSFCAGITWLIIFLAFGSPLSEIWFFILFPIPYFFVYVPIGLLIILLSEIGVPFIGILMYILSLMMVAGDPLTFLLHKVKPALVPAEHYGFLNFRVIIFILQPAIKGKIGEDPFFECLNSFERGEKPQEIIKKCHRAIQTGLNFADEAIVHSLLMSVYAGQRDLLKAQEQLLNARNSIGKLIGLSDHELEMFKQNKRTEYEATIDDKLDYRENLAKRLFLNDILICPLYPTGFREDLSEEEKRNAALEWWRDFLDASKLYLLLGDMWTSYDIDYAIECFKIVKRNEAEGGDMPPTSLVVIIAYKLGKLYKDKKDFASASKEFKQILSATSHPSWNILSNEEKEEANHWIAKARKELSEIEQ
ncbi:MAG: hypothetical protein KAW92_04670 [Candidatus Cloacimonetes bacterium]|nr:hypothetical protein [Candidatus Cloacimonadota bacterium]